MKLKTEVRAGAGSAMDPNGNWPSGGRGTLDPDGG
jgi:hypothetical protein